MKKLTMYQIEKRATAALHSARLAAAEVEEARGEAASVASGQEPVSWLQTPLKSLEKADAQLTDVCLKLEELAEEAEYADQQTLTQDELLDDLEEEEGLEEVVRLIASRLKSRAGTCAVSAAGIVEAERLLTLAAGLIETADRWDGPVLGRLEA